MSSCYLHDDLGLEKELSMSLIRFVRVPSLVVLACAACGGAAATPQTSAAAAQSPNAASPQASDSEVGTKLHAALAGSVRLDRHKARDIYRHPYETLTFFGLKDDASVVELWPGSGYYTSILAPVLADHGKLTITHFDPNGDPKSEDTDEAKGILGFLDKHPDVFGKVARQQISATDFTFGPDGSADFVFTFRNIHNWIQAGYADKVFAASARVLKSGGVFGVEEHRGKPGMTDKEIDDTGYVPEDRVIALAQAAGLRLVARSEVNANAKDTKDYPQGVWSLPPSYAEKDVNHDKYAAIGESDRMTLKFQKP
jgi:predicted methyltransferase